MICRPQWPTTKRVMGSSFIFIPVALAYTVLLAFSWEPDTLALILPGSLQAGLSGEVPLSSSPRGRGRVNLHDDVSVSRSNIVCVWACQVGSSPNSSPACRAS